MPEAPSREVNLDPELFKVRLTSYIPIEPTLKQHIFLLLNEVLELFYGGSGGGAKSYALLMGALVYVDQPDYSAIIFRESYQQLALPGGLLDVAEHWLIPHNEVHYDKTDKLFTFPSGARLKFAYMQAEQDKFNYQSSEFQYIGFDEVTGFSLSQYLFLYSRLRKKAGCNIPLRMRSASNPIGQGFEWVKDRFITNRQPGVIFLPAKLSDNPHIDKESYIKSLDKLDPITREKILNGDWNVREESVMFKTQWFKTVLERPVGISNKIRVWDMAATAEKDATDRSSYTVGTLLARLHDKTFCVLDIIRLQGSPKEVEETIKSAAVRDGRGVEIFIEQEGGSSGKSLMDHYARNVLLGWSLTPVSPTGSKVVRAQPLASYMEKGYFSFVASALTPAILDEFLMFPIGKHSDCVDSVSHAFNILSQKSMHSTAFGVYGEIYQEEKKILPR